MDLEPPKTLLLVPTALELERLRALSPECVDGLAWASVELAGFGPVAAAARSAALIAQHRPSRLLLVGIAGGYAGLDLGTALSFGSVALDGVGAGEGHSLRLPSAMGFPQVDAATPGGPVHETTTLAGDGPELLTVCAASEGGAMLAARTARFPNAVAEDMEAFGVALSARAAGVRLHVIRGISNAAGDRDVKGWKIDEALATAASRVLESTRR